MRGAVAFDGALSMKKIRLSEEIVERDYAFEKHTKSGRRA